MQRKNLTLEQVDIKMTGDGYKFSGYASVFGGVDSYGDTIHPGAYKNTLSDRDRPIALRWNHHGPVIGKWTNMQEDETGLLVEGELTKGHSTAEDAYALLKHGAITGLSIGYMPVKEEPNETGGVDLYEIALREISVVESPADLGAQIGSIKSGLEEASSLKEVERLLRDATGLSRTEAQTLISRIKSLSVVDPSPEDQAAEIATIFQQFKLNPN